MIRRNSSFRLVLLALFLTTTFVSWGFQREKQLNLMPVPQEVAIQNGTYTLNKDFRITLSGEPDMRLLQASTRFLRKLSNRTGLFLKEGYVTTQNFGEGGSLHINVNRPGQVKLHEDES